MKFLTGMCHEWFNKQLSSADIIVKKNYSECYLNIKKSRIMWSTAREGQSKGTTAAIRVAEAK